MTQAEKIRIIADAMEGKCKIELTFDGKWFGITFDGEKSFRFSKLWHDVYELLDIKIRIAKSIPLLSDADADFAEKYLPHDWWITKNEDSVMYIFSMKPIKGVSSWVSNNFETLGYWYNLLPKYPTFESIKWEDEDCYTIQELLDHYKESKK